MELSPVKRKSLKSGLITVSAVSDENYPIDACLESLNFNFDTIGNATLRKGSTQLGNTMAASDILGLYNFRDSGAGSNNQLIAVNGTVVYYLSGSTWTSKRTGLSASKARFSTFLDFVFMVNGTDATAIWDGNPSNNFLTTGNALNTPTGKFIDNFRARMWIAGNTTYPDRVYYSSIPSAVTTPIITWDTSVTTGQWIDISPSDGENITALHRTKGALLVFKNNHIYRIFSILQTDPDPQFNVGTYSQESVIETKNGVYFHHPTGFYRYDGNVTEISRPIIDIVKNITLANYSKVSGWVEKDGDHICWSVGDCTVNGVAYTNLVVRYTISTQCWSHYSFPSQFLVGATYNNGTTLSVVVGDEGGKIFTTETGLTDNGTDLFYSLIQAMDNIDGSESTEKNITGIMFNHTGGQGANITYRTNKDVLNNWSKKVLQLKQFDTGILTANIKGNKVQFRCAGTSKGEPFIYEGYEILKGTRLLNTFN